MVREKILDALLELSGRSAARSRPELIANVLRHAMMLGECEGAAVALLGNRRMERWVLRRDLELPMALEDPRAPSEFARSLLHGANALAIADVREDARLEPGDACPGLEAGPALFIPLRVREQTPGYVAVFRRVGASRFSNQDARLLALLVSWMAMALDNQRLSESLEKLAVTDDLTQVYNFRYLKTALRREIKRADRFRQSLSIIMVDVDNLKAYNDRNGHLRGSYLLKEIAQLFAQQVRSWDLVAKYGGDEFTVILPQTESEGALVVADRLRASVEAHTFPLAPTGSITVSAGIATYPQDGDSGSSLIEASDRALYQAKRHGRNCVEIVERDVA